MPCLSVRALGACLAVVLLGVAGLGCKADPKSPEYWEKALKDARKAQERVRVLDELRGSGNLGPAFLPMLHGQLGTEKKAEVKVAVVRLIGQLKDRGSVQPLVDAVSWNATDGDANKVNRELASALGQIGDAAALPTLMRMLKARDNYVQVEAIQALGALRAKEAVEPLIAIALDDNSEPFIAKKAVQALGEIADPKAVPALVKLMFKQHPRGQLFYAESSFALYQIGQPASDALLPVIKGEDKALIAWARENRVAEPALYAKSAQVLGDLHEPRATPALLSKLAYKGGDPAMELLVRMKAADALGRLRAKEGAKPISALVGTEEPEARIDYAWALARIGSRDALPALLKSAPTGIWDAREASLSAIGMIGDEREVGALEKLAKEEPQRTAADCSDLPDYPGCRSPDQLGQKHAAFITSQVNRALAAKECRSDGACWIKKLTAPDAAVRGRAAVEIARAGKADGLEALLKQLSDADLDVRLATIQAVDWLVDDSPEARKRAVQALPAIDKQLNDERGKTEFVKVNEDLKRLAAKLKRA
jgi:HEAT repeat protein